MQKILHHTHAKLQQSLQPAPRHRAFQFFEEFSAGMIEFETSTRASTKTEKASSLAQSLASESRTIQSCR